MADTAKLDVSALDTELDLEAIDAAAADALQRDVRVEEVHVAWRIAAGHEETSIAFAEIPDTAGKLVAPDDVITSQSEAWLLVDHYLDNPVACRLVSTDPQGFTAAELVNAIYKVHAEIWKLEGIPLGSEDRGVEGPFGIGGKLLDGLFLEGVGKLTADDRNWILVKLGS